MSRHDLSADDLSLPIKRTTGDTIEDRLTANAYHNILPARYLRKDANGDLIEQQEDLFERVARNIALAEAVFEANDRGEEITVTPDQLKPDHPRRDELAEEVFGAGVTAEDDAETTLSVYNVNKFAYETVVPELPVEVREHVEDTAAEFQQLMESLSFMPNCVPPDSTIAAEGGLKRLTEIEPGERVYDDEDGRARVESTFENGEKLVKEIETVSGYTVRATPEHYFRVIADDGEYEWRQVKNLRPDDVLALQKNFLDNEGVPAELQPDRATDGGTVAVSDSPGRPRSAIETPDTMTPTLAEWLGLYLGNGTARESGVRVAFDEQDDDLVDYWQGLTDELFGFEPTTGERPDAECVVGRAFRRSLYEFLDRNDLLKETSKTATVPAAVLESGRTCIARFLRGLFEADGTVGDRAIEMYTHSEPLADQVQQLLLGLGIRSKIRPKGDGYRVTVRKNVCGKRFVERVGFRSERKRTGAERFATDPDSASSVTIPNQSERLHEWYQESELGHDAYRALSRSLIDPDPDSNQEIGVGIFRRYAEEYPELWNSPVAEFVERDQFYEPVSEIRDVGRMAVEDMQVPRRNTYVVEGFVSHNSPTLMNAGDELQQLSACFVDSPEDDIDDIHQTAKEAAQVFQCLTEDSTVVTEQRGVISVSDVEAGDRVAQRTEDGFQFKPVEETHVYEDAETLTVNLENGLSVRGTPNHRLKVDGEWTRLDAIRAGQEVHYALGWLRETDRDDPELASVTSDAQRDADRGVENAEIADALDVHQTSGGRLRAREQLEPNGTPVESVSRPSVLTEDLAELVGLWLGDGSRHRDGVRFHVGRESIAEYIDHLTRQLFGTPTSRTVADGRYEVSINSREIERWWQTNFDRKTEGARSASVPQVIKNAPAGTVEAFLRGYFTADGTLLNDTYPKLYSPSEQAIDDVATLMMGLGYPVKKSVIRDEEAHPYYGLVPTTGRGREAFLRDVGFVDERREIGLENVQSVDSRDVYSGDDEYTVVVESVAESDTTTVYDITVADNPEYVTDGVISHNSGGGMGYAFWRLRPYGDPVGSTGGIASGPITFMRTYDQMCETIAQGGARRGAQMGVMRVSHPDVIQFIHAKNKDVSLAETLRLNDPDDFTHNSFQEALEEARELIDDQGRVPEHLRNAVEGHLSNFNISVGVTDDFMDALEAGEEFTFTNPRTGEPHVATEETKELYDMFGLGEYVEVGEVLSVPAEELWEDIVEGAHENGEPGVIYLERVNKQHSFDVEEHPDHRILATNPCLTGDMEIQLSDGTTAPIETLADDHHEVTVKSLNDGEVLSKSATAFKTKSDADVVKITTGAGTELRVTPDHEIRSADRGWIAAADLSAGDELIALSEVRATPHGAVQEQTTVAVASVEDDGCEDVYDLSVEGTHNFFASATGGESINVHNCGEQPLEEYEACNLGHINLSTLAAEDAPDWRVWSRRHADDYDTTEAAVEAFLEEAVDWEEFDRRIEMGTRFLENVVTMSDFPVGEIERKVRQMRKIGLGIMGLAQLYIQLGTEYGDDVSNEIASQLMRHINHGSKWTSHELAGKRGTFEEWDDSKYADPTEYREWFEHQTGLDADEWEDGFPIRNHNTTTIAPTGTTSMVGNTTGGCEPIYNVAYYKNVSDDVQGDEMLVEFDDYFLRVLEENDLDVEAVKEEATDQMANNEFDGIDGLTTVPDAIGELFVTTGDLTAKEHAAVQCACQEGVDSAISKTVNAPNDSTVADAKEVFEYIYDHGGKGVTYYRDGTRSKQVLTTRAQNTEFADMDPEEIVAQIEDIFGGIEGFLEDEAVQAALEESVDGFLDVADGEYAEKRPRPDVLHGVTQRIDTGYGKLYVNINEDEEGRPFELFANIGNSGGFTASFTEALAKTISTALRSGVDPREIADELQGIRSPKVAWDKGEQIQSIPDAIGTAMRRYLDDDIERAYPQQRNLTELEDEVEDERETADTRSTDGGGVTAASGTEHGGPPTGDEDTPAAAADDQQELIDRGESPECPECGSLTLYYAEGCKTCESCGWSEC